MEQTELILEMLRDVKKDVNGLRKGQSKFIDYEIRSVERFAILETKMNQQYKKIDKKLIISLLSILSAVVGVLTQII